MSSPDSPLDSAILKLSEVLHDSPGDPDTLLNHLHFAFDAERNVSTIEVKFVDAGAGVRELLVILPGVNLTAFGASDGEIVRHLIERAATHPE